MRKKNSWQEFQLIDLIRQRSGRLGRGDQIGIGDDASAHCVDPRKLELITCDALVEGVHWESSWCDPESLGVKSAAVNLSDIAAMGGTPQRAFLVLALPPKTTRPFIIRLIDGLVSELSRFGVRLAGGDTVLSPGPIMVSLTLQGTAAAGAVIRRTGARLGDLLLVTGELGTASAGLGLLRRPRLKIPGRDRVVQQWLRPIPRLREGGLLARSGQVHAMIDLSDGLAGDARRLTQASRTGACIFASQLPVSLATRVAARALKCDPLNLALSGGEDYELLFSCPSSQAPKLIDKLRKHTKTICTVVGKIIPQREGIYLIQPNGRKTELPSGWEHGVRE
jgi:thiamine-monophosphate kinase